MADPGIVTTARGGKLNMHELRMRAKRPMSMGDQKDKVQPRREPVRQLNIIGFMPSMAGVTRPNQPQNIPAEIITEMSEDENPSIADLTGIIIDTPKHLKAKPGDAATAANDALKGIIQDLEQYRDRPRDEATTKRRAKQS